MRIVQTHKALMVKAVKALGGQKKAAKFFGLSQASISRIINGKQELPRSVQMLAILVVKGQIEI